MKIDGGSLPGGQVETEPKSLPSTLDEVIYLVIQWRNTIIND